MMVADVPLFTLPPIVFQSGMNVSITVSLRGRTVPLDQVSDKRISEAFAQAGRQVASKLECIRCPVHAETAKNVRLHFDASGNADLQYDSCCDRLGAEVRRSLG